MTAVVDVVIHTTGRDSLPLLLAALDGPPAFLPNRVMLVDDRRAPREWLPVGDVSPELQSRLEVLASGGRGAAAARNVGWQRSRATWVAFLDDDVIPCRGWHTELLRDLAKLPRDVGASQGNIRVPLPSDRAPTDRERTMRGLASARWASADIAYRRSVLRRLGGFDERFRRTYREDVDLALRARAAGFRIATGCRSVVHPVWPASRWASLSDQAVNADDALMRALHGPSWRIAAAAPSGALPEHVAITAAGLVAVAGGGLGAPLLAAGGLLAWLGGTAAFAWRRIAPGPRTPAEIVTMLATSLAIPAAAVCHRVRGEIRARTMLRRAPTSPATVDAVPFDRDEARGLPRERHAGKPRPLAGAREAVRRSAHASPS